MTEPSLETLWRDLLEKDDRTSPDEYSEMALITFDEFCYCIDALTEQRVAAAVQEERERCAGIADNEAEDYRAMYVLDGFREDLRRKDAAARIATLIRKRADRPAPEGAATTKDGDTTRCSTPSQENTGSIGGNRWRPIDSAPKDTTQGDFLISLWNERGDCCWVNIVRNPKNHMGLKIASHWCPLEPPPTDADRPGTASNTDAAQEFSTRLAAEQEPLGDEFTKVLREMPYTESSPTQTVAAPGPTAGGVEPSAEDEKLAINELAEFAADGFFEVQPDAEARNVRHVKRLSLAFAKVRASARAELLAQIREQAGFMDVIFHNYTERWPGHPAVQIMQIALDALADKLTEAK